MILVFTTNENGKIEFTKEELEELLEKVEAEAKKNTSTITIKPQDHLLKQSPFPYIQTSPAYIHQVDSDPNIKTTWTGDDPIFSDKTTGTN